MVEQLARGRGYDRYRQSLYEAAALGVNMSVPYGAWMGSEIQDSFTPPHDLSREIQDFLAANERLFARRTAAEVAVVYSIESAFGRPSARDETADNRINLQEGELAPFWRAGQALSAAALPYDVIMFPEGELRRDAIAAADLARYRTVVLPDCRFLTDHQAAVLLERAAAGGRIVVFGRLGENLDAEMRERLAAAVVAVDDERGIIDALDGGPQLRLEGPATDVAVGLHRLEDGVAMHLIRYDYDGQSDGVPPLDRLAITLRLPDAPSACVAHSPDGRLAADLEEAAEGRVRLLLRDVPLYGIVELSWAVARIS
jgi:hypothetical protein